MTKPRPSAALWMPWFIKDHRAQVATFSHVEHSAYVFLRMLFWQRDGVIPDDAKLIARELRITPKQWSDMRSMLLEDCTISGGQITHPWTIEELAKARRLIEQRRAAGIASAAARANQREGNERSTNVATSVQPRAGSGDCPIQDKANDTDTADSLERGPFAVIGGRK